MKSVMVDTRLRNKIESLFEFAVKFKDIQDMFWFEDVVQLQKFLNTQIVERYYDRELRKGYFDYANENGMVIRYHVKATRGKLEVINEEIISEEE